MYTDLSYIGRRIGGPLPVERTNSVENKLRGFGPSHGQAFWFRFEVRPSVVIIKRLEDRAS